MDGQYVENRRGSGQVAGPDTYELVRVVPRHIWSRYECDVNYRHTHTHTHTTTPTHARLTCSALPGSDKQVPQDQRPAKRTRCPKHLLRRAPALRRPLELLVAAPDVLRRVERVVHQLLNVRRLHAEVVRQRRLQLRDFRQRLFRGAVTIGVSQPACLCLLACRWQAIHGRGPVLRTGLCLAGLHTA